MAASQSSQVRLSPTHLGLARIEECPPDTIEVANELLQKNHEQYHMYFRDAAGHNHIAHSILTVLALGGGPKELHRAYDDSTSFQRPIPKVVEKSVHDMHDPEEFMKKMVNLEEYTNFLSFFEQEMDQHGWREVVNKFCFSHTTVAEAMFAQLFEGLYHPLLQLGFGVEFDQPSIVAEGLAHAASHWPGGKLAPFFQRSETLANSGSATRKSLVALYTEMRADEKIRTSARISDGPHREMGLLERAIDEIVPIAAQFQVPATTSAVERATAEMFSCAAYTTAAQRAGKMYKADFFLLHLLTSAFSIYVMLQEPWITIENKARLLEWKGRLDLVWYAANGSPEMDVKTLESYEPTLSKGMDWRTLYKAANEMHDDGHVVKLIRALKLGEEVLRSYEADENITDFPIHGNLWLKIAGMSYDTTYGIVDNPLLPSMKWVFGSGFDMAWQRVPDQP